MALKALKRKPNPIQEVKPLSNTNYDELTQALPLLGMRVMINPKFDNDYNPEYRGITGTIINTQGDLGSTNDIIRQYKRGISSRWTVSVKWDEEEYPASTINTNKLLPVFGVDSTLHKIKFTHGITVAWTEKDYNEKLDIYLIVKGYKISEHIIYNEEKRRKIFESLT
jgi:hypothetical protein